MEIKTTNEIYEEYNILNLPPKKKWIAEDDLIRFVQEYECPHGEKTDCNCCDGIAQLGKVLIPVSHKIGGKE